LSSRWEFGGKGEFVLASGEEANNREKAREVYCPQDYYSINLFFISTTFNTMLVESRKKVLFFCGLFERGDAENKLYTGK